MTEVSSWGWVRPEKESTDKNIMKLVNLLVIACSFWLVAWTVGDVVELESFLNGRSSASFAGRGNIRFSLPQGTQGQISEVKELRLGYGLKITIRNGARRGQEAWVYYKKDWKGQKPWLKLHTAARAETSEPGAAASVLATAVIPTIQTPEQSIAALSTGLSDVSASIGASLVACPPSGDVADPVAEGTTGQDVELAGASPLLISIEHTHSDQKNCPNEAQIRAMKYWIASMYLTNRTHSCRSNFVPNTELMVFTNGILDVEGQQLSDTQKMGALASLTTNQMMKADPGHREVIENYFKTTFATPREGNIALENSGSRLGNSFSLTDARYSRAEKEASCNDAARDLIHILGTTDGPSIDRFILSRPYVNDSVLWNKLLSGINGEGGPGIGNCAIPNTTAVDGAP
jgi:hypothetical protein